MFSSIWWYKILWYISIAGIFQYLQLSEIQVFILSVMMVIDTITWVLKQYRLDPKLISSHWLWGGVIKKILTIMFLFSFALMFKWIWIDWKTYITSILSILIVSEFYSTTQNIYSFRTWQKVQEYDAISVIIKYIWDMLLEFIENKIWKKK